MMIFYKFVTFFELKSDLGSFSSPPPPPTSHNHQFSGVIKHFTRLDLHAKFCINRTMRTDKLPVKVSLWGKEKI